MRKILLAVALLFSVYFPLALWSAHQFTPDQGPPASAGIRVLLNAPFIQWPGNTFAATISERNGLFFTTEIDRLELWEDGRKLGPNQSTLRAVTELGNGRYLIEPGVAVGRRVTFASSDNSNPVTNGRRYWVVNPQIIKRQKPPPQ